MFEPGWILIGFIDDRLGDTKQFNPARLRPIPIFYGTPNFPIFMCSNKINSSPSQTSMAATNMFEPGWIPDWFHWGSSRGPKTSQTGPAQTNSHFLWDAKLPYNHCSNTKFFSNSNFHGGYKYVWAGLNHVWFHWESSRKHKTIQSSPAQTHSHLIWDAKLPYILQSDNKFFSISNFHGGYIYVWAGLNPDWFHWGSSRGHKTIQSSPAQTIPIFYGTPNFPIIIVQTKEISPSQTSMAATNMFEPGWILTGFIEDRLGDTKQFNPARLRPIPIFYGTPNFPIFCVQTINSSPSQTSMAATNMFEPGWILIGFIEDRLGDTKQFNPARPRPIPIFYGTPNFPIIIVQTQNSSSTQTSMAATNMFEPGWILIGFIEDRLGDTKQFNPARLKPIFPFSMGRQTSLYSSIRQ